MGEGGNRKEGEIILNVTPGGLSSGVRDMLSGISEPRVVDWAAKLTHALVNSSSSFPLLPQGTILFFVFLCPYRHDLFL